MRILIADDESIIRLGLKAMLQELGHEVMAATNGRDALEMARHHLPDLAILDIKMPYTDGLQAAQILSKTQPLPIILLTAYSQQDLIEKATDLPIHGYLIKPVTAQQLTAAMALAVKRFQEAHDLQEALETRKWLDKAKAKLMKTGLSEEEAHRAIQQKARAQRQDIRQAAQAILREEG